MKVSAGETACSTHNKEIKTSGLGATFSSPR